MCFFVIDCTSKTHWGLEKIWIDLERFEKIDMIRNRKHLGSRSRTEFTFSLIYIKFSFQHFGVGGEMAT